MQYVNNRYLRNVRNWPRKALKLLEPDGSKLTPTGRQTPLYTVARIEAVEASAEFAELVQEEQERRRQEDVELQERERAAAELDWIPTELCSEE